MAILIAHATALFVKENNKKPRNNLRNRLILELEWAVRIFNNEIKFALQINGAVNHEKSQKTFSRG